MPAARVTSTRRNDGGACAARTAPAATISSAGRTRWGRRRIRSTFPLLWQDEALLDREQHELRRLVHAERAHEIRAVHGDRVDAQVEHHRDLLVRLAVRNELQDLLLALRELVVRIVRAVERSALNRAD